MNESIFLNRNHHTQVEITVKQIADRIIRTGKMSRKDYKSLTSAMLAHSTISEGMRRQINRIFDCIQTGQMKFIDW